MLNKYIGLSLFFLLFFAEISAQGQLCADAEPFCAGGTALTFPNSHPGVPGAQPFAEAGLDYSCSSPGGGPNNPSSWPFPSWYFLQVDSDGDLTFSISQTQNADGTGTPIDVDFIAWGPFTSSAIDCSVDLNNANKVDCSWLDLSTEIMDIPGAQAGEVYLVMITNFDEIPGFITLQQTNVGVSGAGGTDCSIVNSIDLCEGDTTDLDATTSGAVSYEWTRDGNPLSETGAILTNVSAPSAVYDVVALNSIGNVVGINQFNVNFEPIPVFNPVEAQFICDDNNDGFFDFDFTTLTSTILGTQTNVEVSYHNSLSDAQMDMNPINGIYTNTAAYTQEEVFVRLASTQNRNCISTGSFFINVFNSPTTNPVEDILVCDDDNDGFWDFDLDALRPIVLGTQDPAEYGVSFHLEESEAISSSSNNPLPDVFTNPIAYQEEQIWIRVENSTSTDANNCFEVTSFNIDVFNQPFADAIPAQLVCDDDNDGFWDFDLTSLNATVLGTQNATQFNISYHSSMADAMSDMAPLPSPYTNQIAYGQEDVFVRIENIDNSACYETTQFVIQVFESPTPLPVTYSLCDNNLDGDDTNGFVEFDLQSIDSQILNGQDPTQFTVTYHANQVSADTGTGNLVSPYTNTTASNQQIIARVENNDRQECFETVEILLQVNTLPIINDIVDLVQCDDDTDGISDFNLTEANSLISSNSLNETFTYYLDAANAASSTNPIPNPTVYTNLDSSSNPDVIFVRVETGDGCFRLAQLNLFVAATQIPNNIEILYEICDVGTVDNDITNGIESFDFSDAEAQIRAQAGLPTGQNLTFSYYENETDALAEVNAIPDISNHRNDASPFEQEIYVRVDSDVDNDCIGLGVHVRLRTTNPTPNTNPNPIVVCDDLTIGDLRESIDLTVEETFIFNGNSNLSATYHTTLAGANSGDNSIPSPTNYINSNPTEIIFVRVENNSTACYAIVEQEIQVNPLPDNSAVVSDFFECENNTDFIFDFDLESKTPEILNGQDPANFTVTYHDTQLDADNLTNPLTSPYQNTSTPQTIFVAITNNTTGCSVSTITFNIDVLEGANAQDVLYEECDIVGDNDGFTQFDLASQSTIILNGQDPSTYQVSYHFSLDDANTNSNPLPLLYENFTVNSQVIYARVSNIIRPDECFEISEVTLQVNPLPIFDLDDEYTLCLMSNDEAVIPLTPVLDTGLSATDYTFEWRLNGVVLDTEIGPSLTPTQGGIYDVTVTDIVTSTVTMCTNFDSAEVIESSLPDTLEVELTSEAFTGNNIIIATASGISTYEYSLDNGPWQLENEFTDVTGGEHVVFVRDVLGCGILSRSILVIDYPKFFTPNGDGNNDTWTIKGIDTQPTAAIYIHDRYGKLLKQLSPTSPGWDGTFNGSPMPSSDYWFTLEYIEPTNSERRTFSAHFALKR